jgi:hypothetical protein
VTYSNWRSRPGASGAVRSFHDDRSASRVSGADDPSVACARPRAAHDARRPARGGIWPRDMRPARGAGWRVRQGEADRVGHGVLNPSARRGIVSLDERRLLKSVEPSYSHSTHFPFSPEGFRRSSSFEARSLVHRSSVRAKGVHASVSAEPRSGRTPLRSGRVPSRDVASPRLQANGA